MTRTQTQTQRPRNEYEIELAKALSRKFICRSDAKAIQTATGYNNPARGRDGKDIPWKMGDLINHLHGKETYGYHTSNSESLCKLFVLDVDLAKEGTWVEHPDLLAIPDTDDADELFKLGTKVHKSHPREVWREVNKNGNNWEANPETNWYAKQMRLMANMFTSSIHKEGLNTAAVYSGNKGFHVYGFFPEPIEIAVARSVGLIVLEKAGGIFNKESTFEYGNGHFTHTDTDPEFGFTNFEVEVFPKQDEIHEGGYGSMVRLPLGVNKKSPKSSSFIIDQTLADDKFEAHPDPLKVLTTGNPWLDHEVYS